MNLGRHCPRPVGPPEPREVTPGLIEAKAAHRRAVDALHEVIGRGPEVREAVARVADHGRRNHFYMLIEQDWRRQ